MIKRLLALLMSLVLVFSLLPVSVFAEEETGEGIVTEEETVPADPMVEETTVQEEISEETENTTQEEIPEETENTTQQEAFEESETFDAAPEEPSESMQELPHYSVPFQVNPLYEGLVTFDDLSEPEEPIATYAEPVYGTVAEAQAIMREALKNRVTNVSVYILDDEYDFYGTYPEILYGAMNHTGDPTEGDFLLYQYGGCSIAGDAMIDPLGNYYITFTYELRYYDTLEQEEELDVAVRALLNQLNLYGKSDYEKIAGIYGWMCKNIYYDYTNLSNSSYKLKYTAYAALINKTAVCQGYANLFYRLALELGVDSRIISGLGITNDGSGPHAWNIVGLDGLYYDADATWDATYQQFAMDYGHEMEYFWFLKNEAEFSQDHVRDEEFTTAAFHAAYPMATADYVYTEPVYPTQGTCGANLTWKYENGTLTISGEGAMYDYSTEANPENAPWINYLEEIETIVVEEGVTSVGSTAFSLLSAVTSVSLPETLTAIGGSAFHNCVALEEIVIPAGVTSIGNSAFTFCYALADITFEGSAPAIGTDAFGGVMAATAHYTPDATWTVEARQNYGGSIIWVSTLPTAAEVNGVGYATVAEALAAANSGDTVQLMQDVTEDKVMVLDGATLDLNGYSLEVNYVFAVNGCHIVDNSENNTGLLISDPDNVMISTSNSQLPVWNGEGYIFSPVTYKTRLLSSDHDSLRFAFLPEFKDGATALLEDGAEGNKVSIEVRVSWLTTLGREYRNLVFNERQVDTVVGSGGAFILTFSGFSNLEMASAIRVEGIVISDTGVSIASPAVEVDVTTAE